MTLLLMLAMAQMAQSSAYPFMNDLFSRYQGLMFHAARRYLGTYLASLEDVVEDSLLSLLEHEPQLMAMEEGALKRYIVAVVRSKAMDVFRQKQRMEAFFQDAPQELVEQVPAATDVEQVVMTREMLRFVQQALRSMPEKEAAAFRLKVGENYSDEAIARSLQISVASVRKYVSRVRERLRAAWMGDDIPDNQKGGKH